MLNHKVISRVIEIQVGDGDQTFHCQKVWNPPTDADRYSMETQYVDQQVLKDAFNDGFEVLMELADLTLFVKTRPSRTMVYPDLVLRAGVGGARPGKRGYAHAVLDPEAVPGLRRHQGFALLTLYQKRMWIDGRMQDIYIRLFDVTVMTIQSTKTCLTCSFRISRYDTTMM